MKRLIVSLLLAAASAAHAAPPADSVLDAWFKANVLSASVGIPGDPDVSSFTFEITPDNDLRIVIVSKEASGSLMLVSGVLLIKDYPIEKGYEIDAIDGPVLTMQVLNKLLAYGAGGTPSALRGRKVVDVRENTESVHVATSSAEGTFGAPWHLVGSIEAVRPGVIDFQLTHTFTSEEKKTLSCTYKGRWQEQSPSPALPDSLSLKGWKVFDLGPRQFQAGGGIGMDYGASASASSYATVGDLRSAIRLRKK